MPAPGYAIWRKCSGGHDVPGSHIGDGSQPSGPRLGFFIEYFDAVNGAASAFSGVNTGGATWNNDYLTTGLPTGPGAGQVSSAILYDSHMNSMGIHHSIPGINTGDAIALTIGGEWKGCHQFMGYGSQSVWPSFHPAILTQPPGGQIPPGQNDYITPKKATSGQKFNDCFGCVWGATDPAPPNDGWVKNDMNLGFKKAPPKTDTELDDAKAKAKTNPEGEGEKKELREEIYRIKELMVNRTI
jgi:hypothetical protein